MEELNAVTHHGARYGYKTNDENDLIVNRDALPLMDKVSGSLSMTLVNRAIPKSDKFFIAHSVYSNDNNIFYGTSFRRLTMEDVRMTIIIQMMMLGIE